MLSADTRSDHSGLRFLLGIAAGLALLRIGTAYFAVPIEIATLLSVVSTLVFVATPILALYRAASDFWSTKSGFLLLGIGVLLHVGGVLASKYLLQDSGLLAVICLAFAQSGLLLWCAALGVLLALLIKDKNLLLPVSAFLAGLDMFLVFAPIGIARQVVEKNPTLFKTIAYNVPKIASGEAPGVLVPMAFVGPADFFFLGMFFVALYRFHMQVAATFRWVVIVLLAYLAIVIAFGSMKIGPVSLSMLPALVPIGLTVLIVNRREFKLSSQERIATWTVVAISAILGLGGLWLSSNSRRAQPAAPLPSGNAPAIERSGDSPGLGSEAPPL